MAELSEIAAHPLFGAIGLAAVFLAAGALIAFVGIILFVFAATHLPRLHFGGPKNDTELHTYDPTRILCKDGEVGKRSAIQRLTVHRWFGLSSRGKPRWLFGILILRQEEGNG